MSYVAFTILSDSVDVSKIKQAKPKQDGSRPGEWGGGGGTNGLSPANAHTHSQLFLSYQLSLNRGVASIYAHTYVGTAEISKKTYFYFLKAFLSLNRDD